MRAGAAPAPLGVGGHNVAEAPPALILVDGSPDMLAVHVVKQTIDEVCAGGVADEARYEVVDECGVV